MDWDIDLLLGNHGLAKFLAFEVIEIIEVVDCGLDFRPFFGHHRLVEVVGLEIEEIVKFHRVVLGLGLHIGDMR